MASSQERWLVRKVEGLKGPAAETITKLLAPAFAGGDFSLLFDKNYRGDPMVTGAKGVFVVSATAEIGALYLAAKSRPMLGLAFYGAGRILNFLSEGIMDFHAYPPKDEPISLDDFRQARIQRKVSGRALAG